MEILVKVGSTLYPTDALFEKVSRDGQLIAYQDNEHKWGVNERKNFAIIRTKDKYSSIIKQADPAFTKETIPILEKYGSVFHTSDGFKWEDMDAVYNHELFRKFFIDFKVLLNDKVITQTQYEGLYNHDKEAGIITVDKTIAQLMLDEQTTDRLDEKKNQGITSGTYVIGTEGGDPYSTLNGALSDVQSGGGLTDDLTLTHRDEDTGFSTDVPITVDLGGYDLTLEPVDGDGHNGTIGSASWASGDGARITCGSTYKELYFINCSSGYSGNFICQDMCFDISGNANTALRHQSADGTDSIFRRNIIKGSVGSSGSRAGVYLYGTAAESLVYNNIIYDVGRTGSDGYGIYVNTQYDAAAIIEVYNNTIIGCNYGIDSTASESGTLTAKNNLIQASVVADGDFGNSGQWGTTAKNITEDSSGPDASYDDTDVYTNSVFKGYATDDFRLDSDGDSTNLAIVDDGDDLSGTFTDDVQGQTRSTWYIGASEIVAAGGTTLEINVHDCQDIGESLV